MTREEKITAVGARMQEAGVPANLVIEFEEMAQTSEPIFQLMLMWDEDPDLTPEDRAEILQDLEELADDFHGRRKPLEIEWPPGSEAAPNPLDRLFWPPPGV